MQAQDFIHDLYQTVDQRNAEALATFLADDVQFAIGNGDPIDGKQSVVSANAAFFSSVKNMHHQIDNVWTQGDNIICNGRVDYVRLDASAFSASFATVLEIKQNQIIDYRVYADISAL